MSHPRTRGRVAAAVSGVVLAAASAGLAAGDLPDRRRELLRLELLHTRQCLGEAVDHDPLVLSLAGEADRKGHASSVLLRCRDSGAGLWIYINTGW